MAPGRTRSPEPIDIFDDDDDGWEDMPIVRDGDEFKNGLDEEDQKKYHYQPKAVSTGPAGAGNARGNLIDFDDDGAEWREKADGATNEMEYTRLRVQEEDESDEVHLRTRYLFDEDKAMTPLNQMQQTKRMLTEAQRIAYVGLCSLIAREMSQQLGNVKSKELKPAIQDMELWAMKIMGRIYYHMEITTEEQKMVESLALHGVLATDLVPALMTTHTVANPEYDPAAARQKEKDDAEDAFDDTEDITSSAQAPLPKTPTTGVPPTPSTARGFPQTTTRVLEDTTTAAVSGVSTTLSNTDENVTLDIRWTVLCDLFLILVADSVYDARSRVLLENVASRMGLGWLDVTKFERRITDALEMQEGVEQLDQKEVVEGRQQSSKKRRYVMMGLATIGGGLVIGLSAGLLAPVIGAGIGTALATVGVTGTSAFLGGVGGAAVITTGGVLTGSGIAARGMARRTQLVKTFDVLPLHNNKRVNCIITVSGFMNGINDDVRLPFSVLDPVVGDVYSVLWEPEMIRETGSALRILTGEVLTQLAQTALQATVMTALMSALQWPLILTKLGYLIDNPWSNALDRAKAAGGVLADVLMQRHIGVRPVTLIGFSLGARVIFYALLELAKHKAYGIVQDVFILGTTVTASRSTWLQARAAVSGRFVNGYARNDWVLNYLFRATSGGLNTVAGLRPVENVPGLENVDVTDKIAGHMSYRTFMPLILDQLGFPVSADYFDEPEEPDFDEDRIVVREGEELPKKKGWFGRNKVQPPIPGAKVSRPPSGTSRFSTYRKSSDATPSTSEAAAVSSKDDEDDLPPRLEHVKMATASRPDSPTASITSTLHEDSPAAGKDKLEEDEADMGNALPIRAGFNFAAIKQVIGDDMRPSDGPRGPIERPSAAAVALSAIPPAERSGSTPPAARPDTPPTPTAAHPSLARHASIADFTSSSELHEGADNERFSDHFSRSLALEGADDVDAYGMDVGVPARNANGYMTSSGPVLSFGGAGGQVWGAPLTPGVETNRADIEPSTPTGVHLSSGFGGAPVMPKLPTTMPRWDDPWSVNDNGAQGRSSSTSTPGGAFAANPWG